MQVELTDHLRCPAAHDEAYLILLPTAMDGRLVREGVLGCPVCRREFPVTGGVARFGAVCAEPEPTSLEADAARALLGLEGPGGYVALVGGGAALAEGLVPALPGVQFVLVNPPGAPVPDEFRSVLRAPRLPVKQASMRGAVLTADHATDNTWLADTIRCVLPGLRVLVEGPPPLDEAVELLAEAGGWWVGKRL